MSASEDAQRSAGPDDAVESGTDQRDSTEPRGEEPDGDPAADDIRQKFRDALDAKQRRSHASAQSVSRDGSEKSHGATGPTKAREFRRKSGS
ncbi:MAG: DUF5302 domain-containing protein [Nocardioidaceae bacterium]